MDSIYRNIINERIKQYGVSTLADEEALYILTGIPIAESKKILDEFGLCEFMRLKDTLELTHSQSKKLDLLFHLVKRINLSSFNEKETFNKPERAGEYFIKELQFYKNEVFMVALLNSQNRLIKTIIISKGTINSSAVYPREVVQLALKYGAKAVILAHNHPSGNLEPSQDDIDSTRKVKAALRTINTTVIDHIIVGENKYVSFAERRLLYN